jgi:hypothetical protein
MRHELKCWPKFFKAIWSGAKTFEVRRNDRNFEIHDEVLLREWEPGTGEYTDREITGFITYVSEHLQQPGYCVFSIHEAGRTES